jgi:hypothetical protein
MTCKQVVEDLFAFEFNKLKIPNHGFVQSSEPSRVEKALRFKIDQFLDSVQRSTEIEDLIHGISAYSIITDRDLESVARATFQEGFSISWGRVVAFIGFTFLVAKLSLKSDDQPFSKHCARWLSTFLDTWLSPWIRSHGGWTGFVTCVEWEKKVKKVKRVSMITMFMGFVGFILFTRDLICGDN